MYLGIDLGTTNSSISGYINSEARVFKTSDGADVLPSVVYIDKRGHRLYGQRAYAQTLLSPNNVGAGFKRLMGTATKIEFEASGLELTPEECSADILSQLLGQALTESGENEISGTVITIPAAFNQMQSEATIRAGRMANFERVMLLQEPIAASMAAMSQSKNKSGQFLVYDLGGGTFDLALVQGISGSVNVIAQEGRNMLGGRDFDRMIVNNMVRPWLIENFDLPKDFQNNPKYKRVSRIALMAAEKAKIALSTRETETIFASDDEVRVTDESGAEIFFEIDLTRSALEGLIFDSIEQTIDLTQKLLKDNGYSHDDIDRIAFIGGPTKMPAIRNRVPQELGIPADLQTDPMTAVAQGAAIYCESRDWSISATTRKPSRASVIGGTKLSLKYNFPARTSNDQVKISVRTRKDAKNERYEIQFDSTTTGWTSGRKTVINDLVINIPVEEMGENAYQVTVFDPEGRPIPEASKAIVITRTHASASGIPATQTISVKIRENLESTRNILKPLIEKGALLPTSGSETYRAAMDLKAGEDENITVELYQDEGVPEPELNLGVGVFRIQGKDLPDEMVIRAGDEVVFHWEMSDSGLITASVELPSLGQNFETKRCYVDQAGHQAFDLENGSQLAEAVLHHAEEELEEAEHDLDDTVSAEAEMILIQERIRKERESLEQAHDPDTLRAVTEAARHVRQDIARLRLSAENRSRALERRISELKANFDEHCRENADQTVSDKFDQHASNVQGLLAMADEKALRDIEAHCEEMERIYMVQLWQDPGYIGFVFQKVAQERYQASDKTKFDTLVGQGLKALEQDDIDGVRRVISRLWENQITVGIVDKTIAKLASIMRA